MKRLAATADVVQGILDEAVRARRMIIPDIRLEVLSKHLTPNQVEAVERRFHEWLAEICPAY